MLSKDHPYWPPHLPVDLSGPEATLLDHLETSARRYPGKAAFIEQGRTMTFDALMRKVEAMAGFLQQRCGLARGDRVILCMQNCSEFVVAYYAILRANAIVVPANPMWRGDELRHLRDDTGANVAICSDRLLPEFSELGASLHCIGAFEEMARAIAEDLTPLPCRSAPQDVALLLYSSGTTGRPKGCIHTHWNLGRIATGWLAWLNVYTDSVLLMAAPLFHITGMINMLISPVLAGATVVVLGRWDRDAACRLTDEHAVTHWTMVPTMVIDLLTNPRLDAYSLASVVRISGGGASMPEAVARTLELRIGPYIEGYGLSEFGYALSNPHSRPKRQCLGIPLFGVDARVVSVGGHQEVAPGAEGELIVHSRFAFKGYWNDPDATAAAFVEVNGRAFLRTGDIVRVDEDGYFFLVDRLKRMVNASGYKVWPAEIESMLHAHPAVLEACVVSAPDPRRGETVKAVVVLRQEAVGKTTPSDIIEWSSHRMAAYKYPRVVVFAERLPRTASGKTDWRALQEAQTISDGIATSSD